MRIDNIFRINFGIVMLVISSILITRLCGILPDDRVYQTANRARLSESLATNLSILISHHRLQVAGVQLELFAKQNEDLVSVGLRRSTGDLVVEVGDHSRTWSGASQRKSDGCYVVPISSSTARWGELEVQFSPVYAGANKWFSVTLLQLIALVSFVVGLAGWLHLRRILKFLDPQNAVPSHVREALDSFAEGVVILDTNDCIVLVNATFANHARVVTEKLVGISLWDLHWGFVDGLESRKTANLKGTRMNLLDAQGNILAIFSVNASPVVGEDGANHGTMLAFSDVTPLERNRAALLSTLEDLSRTKKEISDQNEELRFLVTRDPLTSCINRRTFFEQFDQLWLAAQDDGVPLCAMMVDIDFFKSINDNFGHSAGDQVLREVGKVLNSMARGNDVVCRYGGEEFAVLMPAFSIDEAAEFAEQLRVRLSQLEFDGITITASFGISSFALGAKDYEAMLDEADKCLYVAKRNGRNQVVRYDEVPENLVMDESKISREKPDEQLAVKGPNIPYVAVSALVSALSYRDHQTGAHSVRVSSLAGLLAQRVMSPRDVYVVEMAALLHDIGKVGVPDAILLKPGKLTEEEWEVMEKHDLIGIEIINKSFKHHGLTEIVKYHHFHFGGPRAKDQPIAGKGIPMGARILTIVDSFDAMVSDRPYRKGMSIEKACEELMRCSGSQFDPDLVREFFAVVHSASFVGDTSTVSCSNDVMLAIGEQIERLVEAADGGDRKGFIALAERLKWTAEQNGIDMIKDAADHAIGVAGEDAQLATMVKESFELLAACRMMRVNLANVNEEESSLSSDGDLGPSQ